MSFRDYQKQVDDWVQQFKPPYWPVPQQFTHLVEEVGELAREVNHKYGIKKKKPSETGGSIEEQLAELAFVLCCIANTTGTDLHKEWEKMMKERHYQRDNQRFERKDNNSIQS